MSLLAVLASLRTMNVPVYEQVAPKDHEKPCIVVQLLGIEPLDTRNPDLEEPVLSVQISVYGEELGPSVELGFRVRKLMDREFSARLVDSRTRKPNSSTISLQQDFQV